MSTEASNTSGNLKDLEEVKAARLNNKFTNKEYDQPQFGGSSLNDDMKREYLAEIFDKYTLEEIETALPRRY